MTDALAYIDSYFQGTLSEVEQKEFEKRCETDNSFAEEVAFYVAARQTVREKLLEQKQKAWLQSNNGASHKTGTRAPVRKLFIKKLLPYAVAACLVLAVALFYFTASDGPEQLAMTYLVEKQHYQQLSRTMAGEKDSLQTAIKAYNDQEFGKALSYFQSLHKTDPRESDYIKYSGLVYLQMKEYDKALVQFNELAAMRLQANPGKMLTAITLIMRNKKDDKAEAKKILEQVVHENLEGSEEAEKLVKKL